MNVCVPGSVSWAPAVAINDENAISTATTLRDCMTSLPCATSVVSNLARAVGLAGMEAWHNRRMPLHAEYPLGLLAVFVAATACAQGPTNIPPPSADAVVAGEIFVEPPTLINLGF